MQKKVIIDCDPGQDDLIALMLAFAAPENIELLGITTVAGNVRLGSTQRNARLICEIFGRNNIPVFSGCEKPMIRNLVTAEEYHGVNGLNGIEIFEPQKKIENMHAVNFIISKLKESEDDSIYLVGIAPLTNIAMALVQEPAISKKIHEIIVMGGSYKEGGNVTAAAEFNFYVDPHAAEIVLNCGRPITIFGLDATHQARVCPEYFSAIKQMPKTMAQNILETSIHYFNKAYKEIYDQDSAPIHDVLTIAYLINPSLFSGIKKRIWVETTSELTLGASVVDEWGFSKKEPNATWITKVDVAGFFDLLIKYIAKLYPESV